MTALPTVLWLMKSEPQECSFADTWASPKRTVSWTGVRNYQARNFIRDAMKPGDGLFFYHSSCPQPGIAGVATIASAPYADPTQFDSASPYYDAGAKREAPRWLAIDVRAERACELISLAALRGEPALATMTLLKRGNRLSVMPVDEAHAQHILGQMFRARRSAR